MRTKSKTRKSFAPRTTGLGGAVTMPHAVTKLRAAVLRAAMLLVMMLTVTTQTARAQDTKQDGNWTYKDYGTYALVSAYTGSDKTTLTTLNFPKQLGGKEVMGLAYGFQFKDFSNLQTLNFYINALIDEMPFVNDCSKLAHINTINTNGTTASADCLPDKMKKIPGNCFRGTAITTIDLYKVTSVGSQVFKDCNSLQNVTVQSGATIEVHAFSYIPGSCVIDYNSWVTDWTWEMIAYSPNLYVDCTSGVIGWCGDGNVSPNDFLYWTMDANRNLTIACAGDGWSNFQDKQIIKSHRWNDFVALTNKPITSITLSQVYALGDNEFKGLTSVKSVTLNDGLTSIGASAFEGCTKLTTITIPASVTSIGADAFKGCTALTTVKIEGDPVIADGAIPSGVTVVKPITLDGNGSTGITTELEALNGYTTKVTINRTFPAGKKQTVCLPFAPTELLSQGKVWAFTGISEGNAVMTQITDAAQLKANTPYIFEATSDLTNITFPSAAISIGSDPKTAGGSAGFTFHGTYAEKIWEATSDEVTQGKIYGFMAQDNDGQATGQFVKARRKTILRPFSCWLEYNGDLSGTQNSAARRTTRSADETLPDVIDIVWLSAPGAATGITDPTPNPSPTGAGSDAWYSLDGRRISGEPSTKGVYINNGRKVVIK